MRQSTAHPGDEIDKNEFFRSDTLFKSDSHEEEDKHVPQDVNKITMDKHRGKQRVDIREHLQG